MKKNMLILELRLKTGKTQKRIADEAGITERGYAYIENGTSQVRKLKDETLEGLAIALNTTVDYLLTGNPAVQLDNLENIEENLDEVPEE